jgi:flavin reductase (DIM6/NTAB) family NADH-FMN oxidoreductase RutF
MKTETTSRARSGAPASPPPTPQKASIEVFKAVFRNHPGGVTVITADAGEGPAALTATSVTSVSLTPPLLSFSLSSASSSAPTIRAARTAVVHLLTADELQIATLCSTSGIDRFADNTMWSRLPTGEPYFHGARVWIRGRIVNQMEAGDSWVMVLESLEVHLPPPGQSPTEPLIYHDRAWHRLGQGSRMSP